MVLNIHHVLVQGLIHLPCFDTITIDRDSAHFHTLHELCCSTIPSVIIQSVREALKKEIGCAMGQKMAKRALRADSAFYPAPLWIKT